MSDVTIYTTTVCKYCHAAMDWFKENNITYTEVNITDKPEVRAELKEITKQLGVPVIKVDDSYIIGFNKPALANALGLMV